MRNSDDIFYLKIATKKDQTLEQVWPNQRNNIRLADIIHFGKLNHRQTKNEIIVKSWIAKTCEDSGAVKD